MKHYERNLSLQKYFSHKIEKAVSNMILFKNMTYIKNPFQYIYFKSHPNL